MYRLLDILFHFQYCILITVYGIIEYESRIILQQIINRDESISLQFILFLIRRKMTGSGQHAKILLRQYFHIGRMHNKPLATLASEINQQKLSKYRPYSEMPGPKPLPLLGNTWRFLPYLGVTNSSNS